MAPQRPGSTRTSYRIRSPSYTTPRDSPQPGRDEEPWCVECNPRKTCPQVDQLHQLLGPVPLRLTACAPCLRGVAPSLWSLRANHIQRFHRRSDARLDRCVELSRPLARSRQARRVNAIEHRPQTVRYPLSIVVVRCAQQLQPPRRRRDLGCWWATTISARTVPSPWDSTGREGRMGSASARFDCGHVPIVACRRALG